ncbi:MAG: hypothetical protein M1815_002954 [Lichina confinis]|nr:MAG: hypothetical protein M1815_002954 [Lichina confinis]
MLSRRLKSKSKEEYRDFDRDWVHDRFDDSDEPRGRPRPTYFTYEERTPASRDDDPPGAKIRIDNLHYDLTQEDLEGLFSRIGRVRKTSIRYDRAGRSSGTAFVIYEDLSSAKAAIREYDGANANGQPISLTLIPSAPAARPRNPFDTTTKPARSLFDRISGVSDSERAPSEYRHRRRSVSSGRHRPSDVTRHGQEYLDRYTPGQGHRHRSRSPITSGRYAGRGVGGARDGGRRYDGRRDDHSFRDGRRPGGNGGGNGGGGGAGRRDGNNHASGRFDSRDGRPRKTQGELDAEMEDYWGSKGVGDSGGNAQMDRTAALSTNGGDSLQQQQQQQQQHQTSSTNEVATQNPPAAFVPDQDVEMTIE